MKKLKLPKSKIARITIEKNLVIWENIWCEAKKKGWSQAELARQVGMTPQDVNHYKNGKNMGPDVFARFSYALDVKASVLLGNDFTLLNEIRKLNRDLTNNQRENVKYLKNMMKLENHFYSRQRKHDKEKLNLKEIRRFPLK